MFLAQRYRDRRGAQAWIEGSGDREFCGVFKFDKCLEMYDRNRSFHGPQLQSQTGGFERISIPAPACRASGSVQQSARANRRLPDIFCSGGFRFADAAVRRWLSSLGHITRHEYFRLQTSCDCPRDFLCGFIRRQRFSVLALRLVAHSHSNGGRADREFRCVASPGTSVH